MFHIYDIILVDYCHDKILKIGLNLRGVILKLTCLIYPRPAEGYPIDSYYLMDFSYSMKDDLENLKLLAGNLTEEFRRVSEDFTIGILK